MDCCHFTKPASIGACALLEIATSVANARIEAKPNDYACALHEVATGVANDVGEVKPNDVAAGWKAHATRFADEVRNAKSRRPLTKEEVGKKVHAKMVEAFEKGDSSMAKRGGVRVPDLNTVVRNIKALAAVKIVRRRLGVRVIA